MTDILKFTNGRTINLKTLPKELQERIYKYATLDILKDQAKENINAQRIDIEKYINQWIKTKASFKTRITYQKAINDFFTFINKIGIEHPLLIKAENVDQYIIELKSKIKSNSIRLKISACSSFYSTLKRYGYMSINPFYNSALPKKEYKKAIQPDQTQTIPVMNETDYKAILNQLENNIKLKGKRASIINSRKCAKDLIPAIHFMAGYGLRVGAIPTIEIKDNHFTFKTKGDKSYRQELKPESIDFLKQYHKPGNKPFKNYKVITIQMAFKRITNQLKEKGLIRHNYTCHDLRHYFAYTYYTETKDIVKLKTILGHASINVTDIYLQSISVV